MKRYVGVVAAAALLAGTMAVATDAMAAGHGGNLCKPRAAPSVRW
jgi:hypothetical protein